MNRTVTRCLAALIAGLVMNLSMPARSDAAVRLPQLVGDNMVLQRGQPLRIWGSADPGESVRVSFRGQSRYARADAKGQWSVMLPGQEAGGPYEMDIAGRTRFKLKNILVGDVWLASGQSNMEFALKEADNGPSAIAGADDSAIRLFKLPREASIAPKHDVRPAGWREATSTTVADFSAVAYLFAQRLRERYHVPIGVIESAWGGTYAESWMSESALASFPEFADRLKELHGFTAHDESDYAHFHAAKTSWNAAHRLEDRGTVGVVPLWADPSFDASGWSHIELPRPDSAWGTDFNTFDGTVWFRREIDIPPAMAGHDLELHLGAPYHTLEAYYDGKPVKTVSAEAGIYSVSGDRVTAGRSVIVQRLTGGSGFIMLSGKAENLYVRAGDSRISVAGDWQYQPGTDLKDFPRPTRLAPYYDLPGIVVLSNAMIEPLTPFRIKGVIWYQGESNVGAAAQYARLFPALINDWRRRWGAEFSFLFVQIAGYSPDPEQPGDSPLAELREAQQAALALPHTGMATAVDLGDRDNVHPKNKRDVAARLALAAFRDAYGERVLDSGPTFKALNIDGARVRIQFDHLGSGLVAKDRYGYLRGFALAPKGGPFVWAKAAIDGTEVIVQCAAVPQPVAVRYGWANTPEGNLYNKEGLPAIPFRAEGVAGEPVR